MYVIIFGINVINVSSMQYLSFILLVFVEEELSIFIDGTEDSKIEGVYRVNMVM